MSADLQPKPPRRKYHHVGNIPPEHRHLPQTLQVGQNKLLQLKLLDSLDFILKTTSVETEKAAERSPKYIYSSTHLRFFLLLLHYSYYYKT